MIKKISTLIRFAFDGDYYKKISIAEFAHAHPDLLIIIGNPKTDQLFAAHKNKFVNSIIRDPKGKRTHVVQEVLSHSLFKKGIDSFIVSLVEALHLPLRHGNQFFNFIDGAFFNIAKALRDERAAKRTSVPVKRVEKTPEKEVQTNDAINTPSAGIPSPFMSGPNDGVIKSN